MKVTLVGAGPGDPGLLTIRGREVLSEASVVVYDALANPLLLAYARPDAELIYVGKVADRHAMPQAEINRLLVEKAREKGSVARLKGGDPYIFGRGGEEGEYVVQHGIAFEEVPGISSAIAAPAYAGIPLTHRDFVSSVMIITGHEKDGRLSHNWRAFAESGATLVFVMGMGNLSAICANLLAAGMDPAMPAAVIYKGTTPEQKTVRADVATIAEAAASAGLSNPAVIVIGKVASLADALAWHERKPLLGRTIVVTRARAQASDLARTLANLGAKVIECPSIEIKPMPDYSLCDNAIGHLADYAWIIFTSVNGVKYFWERLARLGKDTRSLAACKVAAIGPATAKALKTLGVNPDLVPPDYVAESVAEVLVLLEGDKLNGMRILIPRALEARMALPEALAESGAIVTLVPMYQTVPAKAGIAEVRELLAQDKLDCVTFASTSTVENFLDLLPARELKGHGKTLLAAIGPITAQALAKHGLKADIQPEEYTIPALVEALVAHFSGARQ